MAEVVVPKDDRIQVIAQDLLESTALTIRNDETGTDARVYGSEDDEGSGFPLRTDDELPILPDEKPRFGDSDGIWIETETSSTTTIQVLKDVAVTRNVRRQQSVDIDADTSGLLKSSDQPLDVSDTTVPVEQQTPVSLEDGLGNQINPAEDVEGKTTTATSSTAGTAAAIDVPNGRVHVTVMWDVSGSATVTVEASVDGNSWYDVTLDFIDGTDVTQPGGAEAKATTATVGADHVRVSVDQNLNETEISAKGA